MKKLTARFTIYFSIGLLLFLAYLALMSSFLLKLLSPVYVQQFVFVVDGPYALLQHIFVLLFCFLTGGALFSVFLVYPLVYIINTIHGLSKGDFQAVEAKALKKNGKVKLPYFLYQEVISNILVVGKELEKARLEREQLDKAKNDWIAGVSHDLKTPLSYITGYSSLLLNKDYQWNINEALLHVEEIYNKGMQLEKLIEDLNMTFFLDHLDASMLRLSRIDLISFLRNLLADAANDSKGQNYNFIFDFQIYTLEITADEALMHRAFYNLLLNAVTHNEEGTEITLKVTAAAEQIFIELSDNGKGMDEKTLQNAFERYSSKAEKPKLHEGLGLSIVKQIIDAHDGEIRVESALEKGTTFYIALNRDFCSTCDNNDTMLLRHGTS